VADHRHHAGAVGKRAEGIDLEIVGHDHLAQFGVDFEHFEHRLAAGIAGVTAMAAADGIHARHLVVDVEAEPRHLLVGDAFGAQQAQNLATLDHDRAMLARHTHQPLRDRERERRRHQEGIDAHVEKARQHVVELAHRVIDLRADYPDEWKGIVSQLPSPSLLADLIASNIAIPADERVELLAEASPSKRLRRIARHLEREITIAETQRTLQGESADAEMDPKRRERLLRRRMRDIESEIGESDAGQREADELRERIEAAELPREAQEHADRELRRFAALPQHAPDRHLIRTYLEWMSDLPWAKETEDHLDLKAGRQILDEDHHDLEKVKDRILEYLAVRKLAPHAKAPILCFVGPPGVGKTSLGRSIARTMGRNFARASLGGVRDEAEIRGHRRTYVGAMPGRILQSIRRAGSRNPVFVVDEIDKPEFSQVKAKLVSTEVDKDGYPRTPMWFFIDSFDALEAALIKVEQNMKREDIVIFEGLERGWELAQDNYTEKVFGKSTAEHLSTLRQSRVAASKLDAPVSFDTARDWPSIRKMWKNEILIPLTTATPWHFVATAASKPIVLLNANEGTYNVNPYIKGIYGNVGVAPEGEKNDTKRFDISIVLGVQREKHVLSIVKNREESGMRPQNIEWTNRPFWATVQVAVTPKQEPESEPAAVAAG